MRCNPVEILESLSGRSLREAVLKYTRHPAQGVILGRAGTRAQWLAGVVLILSGLLSAGILTMRAAIPVLAR